MYARCWHRSRVTSRAKDWTNFSASGNARQRHEGAELPSSAPPPSPDAAALAVLRPGPRTGPENVCHVPPSAALATTDPAASRSVNAAHALYHDRRHSKGQVEGVERHALDRGHPRVFG